MWILITLHKEKLDKLLLTGWLHHTILVIKSSISNNIIIIITIRFNYPSLKKYIYHGFRLLKWKNIYYEMPLGDYSKYKKSK